MSKEDALYQAKQINDEEFFATFEEVRARYVKEFNKMFPNKKNAKKPNNNVIPITKTPQPYLPVSGGAASGGSYGGYSNGGGGRWTHYHTLVDEGDSPSVNVKELIDFAVKEASKEFKLTVDTMQEQIDELWEVIRELEDGD